MRGISLLLLSFSVFSQSELSVRVRATPDGSPFLVDGQQYTSAQFFSWKEGSRHTLAGVGDASAKWTDSLGELGSIGREVTVQATPEVTEYQVAYVQKSVAEREKKQASTTSASSENVFLSRPLLLWNAVQEDDSSIELIASGLQPTDFIEILVDGESVVPSDVSPLPDGFVILRFERSMSEGEEVHLRTADRISNALAISF